MNKEVIYLEPEDDITDILTRIQQADKKLVALVPPKKATMLRSAVNMKLVARVAKEVEKVVVVVTADPAIMKMAMLARIPVAKTLQSRPVVPTEENLKAAGLDSAKDEDVIDEDADKKAEEEKKTPDTEKPQPAKKVDADLELDEKSLGLDDGKDKKAKKDKKPANKKKPDNNAPFWQKYRKQLMIAVPIVVILIGIFVWAAVFAPAATITVAISSTTNDLSEDISFTTDPNAEDLEAGVLYAEKQTVSEKYDSEFTATGEEDRGQKATGSVDLSFDFRIGGDEFERSVASGTTISTEDGKTFTTTSAATLKWDGTKADLPSKCQNKKNSETCSVSATVSVTATGSGDSYNTTASTKWKSLSNGVQITGQGTSGGTTEVVKTVRAVDVSQVTDGLAREHEQEGKDELLSDMGDKYIPIEASYAMEMGEVSAIPAVGDVVGDNTKPKLTVEISYSMYAVAKDKVEQYITQKMNLPEDQQIYEMNDLRFDRFTAIENAAKLKASVAVGPIVSEDAIFDKAKGQKVGRVSADLKSISGVESVNIQTSYFWVNKIPTKREKVTITLEGDNRPADNKDTSNDQESDPEEE